MKKKWYERTEIQKVTLDWLKSNVKPTDRDMELLEIVSKRKLVNRSHLEIIAPSFRHLTNNRTRLINRTIRKLFDSMCLDKVHEKQELGKGNTPAILALERGGSILLGIPHKRRIPQKKSLVNGEVVIERHVPLIYRHTNGINQMEVDTILFCEANGYEIEIWEHEKTSIFRFNNEDIAFIPDVFFRLKVGEKVVDLFLEYDTGQENFRNKNKFPVIYDKVVKYRQYKKSKLWQNHSDHFPIVLLVTEDDKRIGYFNKKCKKNELQGFGVYHKNYTRFLEHLAKMV
ncbi:replication initiation by nicking [Bacillus phage Izhevsk]|uniref:Replic_Relax superfamily protein n=1 Tax=Bacillus phage Izhevsk TaxID=2724322 RepID=A0A6H0X6I1_9CAUD|nr:replication initiation by nicking [Bacillus phage Izhevsk]QIW89919.1 Replic_Relax superfamily protein [Bacillus phage Izhevsk]